jgi:hypothetical protein
VRYSNTTINIDCGATGITVSADTRNPFEGHVYVKDHFGVQGCSVKGDGGRKAQITLPFGTCDMQRRRSVDILTN